MPNRDPAAPDVHVDPPDGDRTVLDERVERIVEEVRALADEALRVRDQDRERVRALGAEVETLRAEVQALRDEVHWLQMAKRHIIASAENKPTFEDS